MTVALAALVGMAMAVTVTVTVASAVTRLQWKG